MKLFDLDFDSNINLLPKEGTVNYFGKILGQKDADQYYQALLHNISWKNDEAVMFGKKIITKRKVAWYGEEEFPYTYSKVTKKAMPWTKELFFLKELIEHKTGEQFNSCLLNLYHSGDEGMAWHSDGEKDLKKMELLDPLVLELNANLLLNTKNLKKR